MWSPFLSIDFWSGHTLPGARVIRSQKHWLCFVYFVGQLMSMYNHCLKEKLEKHIKTERTWWQSALIPMLSGVITSALICICKNLIAHFCYWLAMRNILYLSQNLYFQLEKQMCLMQGQPKCSMQTQKEIFSTYIRMYTAFAHLQLLPDCSI